MGIREIGRLVLLGCVALGSRGELAAQAPPLWGKLSPGRYGVGLKSGWQLDYARRYNMTFDDKSTYAAGKAPRPILVNQWYPADKVDNRRRMPHREYLRIQSDNPLLATYSARLA